MSTTAAPAVTTTTATANADTKVEVTAGKDGAGGVAPTTLASVLQTAINSVKARTTVASELTAARNELATAKTERDTARTERDQARTERDTAVAQLNAIAAFFGVKSEELAGKDAKAATDILAKKVSDASLELVAGLGLPADKLPKQNSADGAESLEEIQSRLAEAKTPEERGILAAKANALRDKAWATGSK
jgi:hypothetical protein